MHYQRVDLHTTNPTMPRTNVSTYVTEEREEEMKQAVEEGSWNTLADYIRHMIRAGESNFAELDPRTVENGKDESRRVSDSELLNQLDDEFQDIDDLIHDLVKDFESDLSHRLFEMAKDDANPVETDGKGNYRIDK